MMKTQRKRHANPLQDGKRLLRVTRCNSQRGVQIYWPKCSGHFQEKKNHKLIKINCLEIDFNESEHTTAAHLWLGIG